MTASALDPAGLSRVTERPQTELTQRGRSGDGRRFRGKPVSLKFQGASTQKQSWPWKCSLEVGPETEAWRVAVTATQPWVNVSIGERVLTWSRRQEGEKPGAVRAVHPGGAKRRGSVQWMDGPGTAVGGELPQESITGERGGPRVRR